MNQKLMNPTHPLKIKK